MACPNPSGDTTADCSECLDDLAGPFLALGLDDDDAKSDAMAILHCLYLEVSLMPTNVSAQGMWREIRESSKMQAALSSEAIPNPPEADRAFARRVEQRLVWLVSAMRRRLVR